MKQMTFRKTIGLSLALLGASGLMACGGDDDKVQNTPENTAVLCQDGVDNDRNDKTDCDDLGCKEFSFCDAAVEGKENTLSACKDGKDNDGDGKTDCEDPDCADFAFCKTPTTSENTEAACQDGIDNDGNKKVDCADRSCKSFSVCFAGGKVGENTVLTCTDGKDNDGDGLADCIDPECQEFDVCAGLYAPGESCDNGKDDDGDTLVDCADAECIGKGTCKDECPADLYKLNKSDGCPCGESKSVILGGCAENIDQSNYLDKLITTAQTIEGSYIFKSHIALGTVDDYVGGKLNKAGIDGNGKRMTGFLTCKEGLNACGLFESINESTVVNLWLAITINGKGKVGSLAATSSVSKYRNIDVSSKAYAKATVKESAMAGGLLAISQMDVVENIKLDGAASAESNVPGQHAYAGGLIAHATDTQIVTLRGIATATSQVNDDQKDSLDSPMVYSVAAGVVALMERNSAKAIIKDVVSASTVQASFYGSKIRNGQVQAGGIVGFCEGCQLELLICKGSVLAQADYTSNLSHWVAVNAGGIVAKSKQSEINSVSMKGTVASKWKIVPDSQTVLEMGGIVGLAEHSKIANASFEGTLNIHNVRTNVGGVVGKLDWGSIANSASRGTFVFFPTAVGTDYIQAGGVVGYNDGKLVNTYAKMKDEVPEGLEYTRAALVGASHAPAEKSNSFLYESYWSKDDASVISTTLGIGYIDATCENFLLNGKKPEINAKTLLGALRYNIGMANGVVSVNLPRPDKYLDWKEVSDVEGNVWPELDFEKLNYLQFD